MPNDDAVASNLDGMDDLDFVGWNTADWIGVFAHHPTDDVLVDWQGQPTTHGIEEHIEAMKSYRRRERGRYAAPDHLPPDRVRIRRVDVRRRGIRKWCPNGDVASARWRHRRGAIWRRTSPT